MDQLFLLPGKAFILSYSKEKQNKNLGMATFDWAFEIHAFEQKFYGVIWYCERLQESCHWQPLLILWVAIIGNILETFPPC